MTKKFDLKQHKGFWAACRVAFNRGRFELANEIEEQIKLAETVDTDKLRDILWSNLGGYSGHKPSREQRNSDTIDTRRPIPDYVQHRCMSAAGEVY